MFEQVTPVPAPPHGPYAPPVPPTASAPAPAPARTRRLLAWALDFAVVAAVAALLGWLTFQRISGQLTDVTGLAEKSVWQVVTSDGDLTDVGGIGQDLGESLWRKAVHTVWQGFGALVVFAFLYHLVTVALLGRTPGQALMGLCVVRRRDAARPGWGASGVRATVVTLADVGWYSLACCMLINGAYGLSVLVWAVAVVFFVLNAFPALVGSRRSLADHSAGLTVTGEWRIRAAFNRLTGSSTR